MNDAPEPTISGNCDSWDFIVGKTGRKPSPDKACKAPGLICHNYLSTVYQQTRQAISRPSATGSHSAFALQQIPLKTGF
jgi:hypothetical protein